VARKSLRSHLNQIRTWVRQGRTDAWIAHQLEVPAAQLRDFKSQHDLEAGEDETAEVDLRDEIEAEIEAELEAASAREAAAAEAGEDEEPVDEVAPEEGVTDEGAGDEGSGDEDEDGDGAPRRRRRRRRGRRGGAGSRAVEATFDHGETDGYGLWLDPAVRNDPVYVEHWASRSRLRVLIEPGRIVLEPADAAVAAADPAEAGAGIESDED